MLIEAGVDILALETIPCLAEVEALLAEIDGSGQPCWLSITCAGDRTRAGEPAVEAFSPVREVDEIIAVGVNCIDPADAYPLVRRASESTGKPVVVYPNSGERWDATARVWIGPATFQAAAVEQWISGGARLVGGCCRVGQPRSKRFVILFRHGPARAVVFRTRHDRLENPPTRNETRAAQHTFASL